MTQQNIDFGAVDQRNDGETLYSAFTKIQSNFDELYASISSDAAALAAHIADASDAHDASSVSVVPAGSLVATDAQAALAELDSDISAHIADTADAHDSSAITFVPSGTSPAVRTARDKMRDLCDIRDFPVDLTGATESTAAFQRFLNEAQTANTTAHLAGGAVTITSELSITAGVRMIGQGELQSQIWLGADNINGIHINTNEGVILENFQIVGANDGTVSEVVSGSLIRVTAPDVNRRSHFSKLRLIFGQTSIHYHRAETWTFDKSYILGMTPTSGVGIINENVGYPGNGENYLIGVLIAGDNNNFSGTAFIDRSSVNTHFIHPEFFQVDNGYVFEPNVAGAFAGKYFTNPVFSQVDNAIVLNKGSGTTLNHFILLGGQIVAQNCIQSDSNNNWLYDLSIFGTQMQCGAGNTAGNGTAIALPAAKSPKISCSILGASGDNSVVLGANCAGGTVDVELRGAVSAPSNSSTTTIVRHSNGTGVEFIDKPVRVTTIELGNDSDATVSRIAAGRVGVEGVELSRIADIQDFTGSGTWTKPTNALWVDVIAIGPGGGGGGGARLASGNAGSGGGGGGAGMVRRMRFKASDLGSTETVTLGTVGASGAGSTSDGVAGSNGTAGTSTTFGSKVTAYAGGRGAGGQPGANSGGGGSAGALGVGGDATTSTAGTGGTIGGVAGGSGAAGNSNSDEGLGSGGGGGATGAAGGAGNHTLSGPCGGGAGGGVAAGPVAFAGGNGGRTAEYSSAAQGGANTGVAGGTPAASVVGPSGGGGGGGGNPTGVGGAGGTGGSYGGGGGGGGAAVGGNGGAGGAGGPGFVRVVSYF